MNHEIHINIIRIISRTNIQNLTKEIRRLQRKMERKEE